MASHDSHAAHLVDFTAIAIDGTPFDFRSLQGQVVLVVNTASECGLTPQLSELETLWTTYRERGLTVVGFPSNEFGGQDPGTNEQIATFCQRNYGVTFPMMAKVEVNGDGAHPVFRWLKSEAPGLLGSEAIKWNFTKFLVGRDGRVLDRFAPQTTPSSIIPQIEAAL